MTATYKKAKYQLVASTIQMTVLLQFNRVDKYTVKDLSKAVGCDCTLMQQVVATLIRNSLLLRDAEPEAPPDDRIPEPECLGEYLFFISGFERFLMINNEHTFRGCKFVIVKLYSNSDFNSLASCE